MEMFWRTLGTKEEIEEGQFLDMPLIIVDKDKDNYNSAPSSIAHSQWAIDPFTFEEQQSSSSWWHPKTCEDDVNTNVNAQLKDHGRAIGSSLELHGFVLQKKKIGFNPKFHEGEFYSKDLSKSTRAIDDFTKCIFVDEFEKLNMIGHVSYGVMFQACDKKTRQVVALKKFNTKKGKKTQLL